MKNLKTIGRNLRNIAYPLLTFVFLLFIWQIVVDYTKIPSYILPSPLMVLEEFKSDGSTLLLHSSITFKESIIGLGISIFTALMIGIVIDFIPFLKKTLYPIIYLTQMIPIITIAPLLIIWFGFGIKSKVLCVVLTCFFPILVNFVDGMEAIDKDYINLFKVMNANKMKTFIHLKFPMSLDKIFTGLTISSSYAFVAATVAEWLGGTGGLGVYMVRAKNSYALDKVFACTLLVVLFSLLFVGIMKVIKSVVLRNYS